MLEVEGLRRRFRHRGRDVAAVDGLSLAAPAGAFLTLLGPSGCGKTTTLRCIAGLERPDAGTIAIGGEVVADPAHGVQVAADRRGVGMVFQSPTIWPHMTVRENVAFPLRAGPRRERLRGAALDAAVDRALALVRLDGLDGRPATALSGGQQQRLALARAVARGPRLLLLDEPLSALDASLRDEVGAALVDVQRALGLTTVYVTHDHDEALALSSHVAVVHAGAVEQVGAPRELYARPVSVRVARALGPANAIRATVLGVDGEGVVVETAVGRLRLAAGGAPVAAGSRRLVVARPEHVRLRPGGPSLVESASFRGDAIDVVVRHGDELLRARVSPDADAAPAPGERVAIELVERSLVLVPEETDAR